MTCSRTPSRAGLGAAGGRAAADAAAAVEVPDPRLGERVCASIVSRPGESLSLEGLIAFLKDKIATYKLPEFLRLLDALPRTPTGKVQKGPLRNIVLEGSRLNEHGQ
jgi:acyl-CoA synthetase (AMP-forming)/AMP-acid ligase II